MGSFNPEDTYCVRSNQAEFFSKNINGGSTICGSGVGLKLLCFFYLLFYSLIPQNLPQERYLLFHYHA